MPAGGYIRLSSTRRKKALESSAVQVKSGRYHVRRDSVRETQPAKSCCSQHPSNDPTTTNPKRRSSRDE